MIETESLILRNWKSSDPRVMEFMPSLQGKDECVEFIQKSVSQIECLGYGTLALERKDNGQFIGYTGLKLGGSRKNL